VLCAADAKHFFFSNSKQAKHAQQQSKTNRV
jgi:hypothetical protein